MSFNFQLRFKRDEIAEWANRYDEENKDGKLECEIMKVIVPRARGDGFLAYNDFLEICRWKTKRTGKHCEKNSPEFVRAVTSVSLSTLNEQLRIEVLTLLRGVGWPTASTILHFCTQERYPILDFRALWSLKMEVPKAYGIDFWSAYRLFCRKLAEEVGVTMRMLDRALWKYSETNQSVETRRTVG